MAKQYTLPQLPYDYSALEPVISTEIMQLHHQKHHNAYVTNLNAALKKYEEAESREDLGAMIALQPLIRFNGGGHINHSIFWMNLAPQSRNGGKKPEGTLATEIHAEFGSFESFVESFNAKAAAIQGSGWCWLAFSAESEILTIATTANQDPLKATQGLVPLLGIDVWEHAYYLQYKNARPDYLKAIWQVVNWSNVAENFEKACHGGCACPK